MVDLRFYAARYPIGRLTGRVKLPATHRENGRLHGLPCSPSRADLTALERDEHIAPSIRLTEKKAAAVPCASCADNDTRKDGRKKGPQHQPRGLSAASRGLGNAAPAGREGRRALARGGASGWTASGPKGLLSHPIPPPRIMRHRALTFLLDKFSLHLCRRCCWSFQPKGRRGRVLNASRSGHVAGIGWALSRRCPRESSRRA